MQTAMNKGLITGTILLLSLAGCRTARMSQANQTVPATPALRETILVPAGSISESAIKEAHKNNLRIFALIDLSSGIADEPLTRIKASFRTLTHDLASKFDIDGLCLKVSGTSPEVIEDIAAEGMLLKPYLINAVIYSDGQSFQRAGNWLKAGIVDLIVPESDVGGTDLKRIPVPDNIKITKPGQVVGLDLSELFPENPAGQSVFINNDDNPKITDIDGCIGFIVSGHDTINLRTSKGQITLSTENWNFPLRYSVTADGQVVRKAPWVELRFKPEGITDIPEYDFLFKTEYPASVRINNDSVKLYKTGIFFKKVTFSEGPNRVRATVISRDSLPAFYESEYVFHKTDRTRKPFPLWINERSVEPSAEVELLPEDVVRVSFQGSLGQKAIIEVNPGKHIFECSREDFADYSLYRGEIILSELRKGKPCTISLKLLPVAGATDSRTLKLELKSPLIVRNPEDFPYIRVIKENTRLVYNLGAPRLGGPIRSEAGPGIIMKVNGKIGENYRIRLSRTENGFISQSDVEVMPDGTVRPSYYITSLSCGPSSNYDVLTIPYTEPVPYEVYPDPDQKRIVITLFGVESSSTWITHLAGRKIIDKITWEQATPETYRIFVNLKSPDIWGYSFKQEGKRLILRLRYPPEYDLSGEKPLSGLTLAFEAGHGGSGTGAIGLSGLVEKDINLDLSRMLGELCRSMGATVVQVRDSDKDMSLIEKRNIVESSEADLFVSIHANAGSGGYLRVAGTSTYYNNPFWAPMAESIYKRLLELGLKEFGVVGSFNYTPIRFSGAPSILVEQAFMSHAEDEEKLADPLFRRQMTEKIYEGIVDYLKYMKKQ